RMSAEEQDLLFSSQIPNSHGPILAGRGEAAAVRAERHPEDKASMSGQPIEPFARCRVPHIDEPIEIAYRETTPIRAERQPADRMNMVTQGLEELARLRIADLYAAKPVPRGQELAIRTEHHAACLDVRLGEQVAVFGRGSIPDLHGFLLADYG